MLFNPNTGGLPVNFRVVGGLTQPNSPKENTIWVKTAIDIPYWTTPSAANAPAYVAKKGTVTFRWESAKDTEVSGTTAAGFMPVKYKATNPPGYMRLKPINCFQNQDGTAAGWKSMDAYIYKGGEWVQFSSTIIYYRLPNDMCTSITGGWTVKGASTHESADVGFTAPTVTDSANKVSVWLGGQFWSNDKNHTRSGGYFSNKKIDLSSVNEIKINVTKDYRKSPNHPGTVVFGVTPSSANGPISSAAALTISGAKEYTLDVSDVDTECYLFLVLQDSDYEIQVEFDKIYS